MYVGEMYRYTCAGNKYVFLVVPENGMCRHRKTACHQIARERASRRR